MTTKPCPKCGETKTVDGFSRHRRAKDGLQSHCKECAKAENASWRAANPDKARAADAAWKAANPDRVKAQSAARYAANPGRLKAWDAAYRAGGRDPDMPWPEGPVGYFIAHKRVQAIYGPAKNHACKHCDGPAAEWAYDGDDPDEYGGPVFDRRRRSSSVMRWSGKPQHYMPLCKRCHIKYDRKKASVSA